MTEKLADATTVILVDDHPLYREGLAGLLRTTPDLTVVGEGGTGREGVDLAGRLHPDVVVLDLTMPDLDGVAACREIVAAAPGTAVLMLTMYDDDDLVFQAMQAGARGYLVKTAEPTSVIAAIRTVAEGGAVLSPALATRLASWFSTLQREHGPFAHLTAREKDVLRLMVKGRDNAGTAAYLGVSPKTVRNVVSSIFAKLGVADRSAAVAKAREAGLT
ncbi:response regulator transcription factor [Knoellia sp. S7-12]|uniref:response regulator transcription factor n=1 Tax=Knoellia sp. S7-12 TaxID=3126698 RepID=UPI00336633F1